MNQEKLDAIAVEAGLNACINALDDKIVKLEEKIESIRVTCKAAAPHKVRFHTPWKQGQAELAREILKILRDESEEV